MTTVDHSNLTAKDVMKSRVMVASRKACARDLAVHFITGVFSGLPVVEPDLKLVGVVSEFDLLKAIEQDRDLAALTAEDVMSKPPITVEEQTPVKDVIRRMTRTKVLRVPVVRNGKLVGIISRSDLLDHLMTKKLFAAYGGF
ncbi:CBS domain-containing protein [Nitrospira sp. Kam-Ns4a]